MQLLITHSSLVRSRAINLSRWQIAGMLICVMLLFLAASGTIYHFIFLKAAREGWPVVSQIVRLVVRDEIAQRDRFMRENLDAIAQKVGDLQAKLVKVEAMGERVVGLAGVKAEELKPLKRTGAPGGSGGPYVPLHQPSLTQLQQAVESLSLAMDQNTDILTLIESRMQESRLQALLVPSSPPVNVTVGSGFGVRPDPFTGYASLHTGLDFPAEVGTPVHAAAGGIVTMAEWHAAYGNTLEIDHGNGLVTRYAHCAGFEVERGALVKRGQLIARVGNTGRSTGPHLHFEVLVDGAPQDPARFLAGGKDAGKEFAKRPQMANASGTATGTATGAASGTATGTATTAAGGAAAGAPKPAAAPVPVPNAAAAPAGPANPAAAQGAPTAASARPALAAPATPAASVPPRPQAPAPVAAPPVPAAPQPKPTPASDAP